MDEQGFVAFMVKAKKSPRAIQRYLETVRDFVLYLKGHEKTLASCEPEDIRGFAEAIFPSRVNYLGIAAYYEYSGREIMEFTAHALFAEPNYAGFKLGEFLKVDPKAIAKLKEHGIETAKQMVEAGRTPSARGALAQDTGISTDTILELVKLSDQARIGGHKRVRARLYHEAGLDTLDKIAALEPEEVRQKLIDFIQETGFDGLPPTPKEAANTVLMARYLPRLVEA